MSTAAYAMNKTVQIISPTAAIADTATHARAMILFQLNDLRVISTPLAKRCPINIRLHQHYALIRSEVDQGVPATTVRANEIAAEIINIRRDKREKHPLFASPAFPHGNLPPGKEILA